MLRERSRWLTTAVAEFCDTNNISDDAGLPANQSMYLYLRLAMALPTNLNRLNDSLLLAIAPFNEPKLFRVLT